MKLDTKQPCLTAMSLVLALLVVVCFLVCALSVDCAKPETAVAPLVFVFVVGFAAPILAILAAAISSIFDPPLETTKIDKSEASQKARESLIFVKYIDDGIFTNIESLKDIPRVTVGPAFYDLTRDEKTQCLKMVYEYCFDGTDSSESVRVFDGRSEKAIGSYNPFRDGLDLY